MSNSFIFYFTGESQNKISMVSVYSTNSKYTYKAIKLAKMKKKYEKQKLY